MSAPNLQQAIDNAGSPVALLWKPNVPAWSVPVIEPEYVGWRAEQAAWREAVAISDLSHHMSDLFIEGPDATRLLMDYCANDFSNFSLGQAKQIVPVTAEGHLVIDGILMREEENKYVLSGVPASQNWIRFHGETGGYDVAFRTDPDSRVRKEGPPELFRYQIQGPMAMTLCDKIFGGPIPTTKFFHSTPVALNGHNFRAFRHGMAGMPGFEFVGEWAHAEYVKEAIMAAGEEYGLVHVGGKAYYTNGIESGWIPTPTAGIYSSPDLQAYREWLSVYSYEGQKPLHGSFFSNNIEDYYASPYELGYGKMVAFNHDFVGRDALERNKDSARRTKVTLVFNKDDAARVFGSELDYLNTYGRYRIEVGGTMVGMAFQTGMIGPLENILSLGLIDAEFAAPGTQVDFVWGEHPGPGHDPSAEFDYQRIRATVAPSPFNEHARNSYRKNA